jgi:hypothetical protein
MAMRKITNNDLQTIQWPICYFSHGHCIVCRSLFVLFSHGNCIVCRSLFVLFLMAIVLFVDHYLFFFSWPSIRKRNNNDLQTIQWPREKEQIMIYKQYNGHEKKNKSFSHGHCIVCRSLFVLFLMAIVLFVDHYLFFFSWPLYCL